MPDEYYTIGIDSDYVESALGVAEEQASEAIDCEKGNCDYLHNKEHARAILNMCFYIAANWNSQVFIEDEVKEYLKNRERWCEEMNAAMTQLKKARIAERRARRTE